MTSPGKPLQQSIKQTVCLDLWHIVGTVDLGIPRQSMDQDVRRDVWQTLVLEIAP
jgi:hypothetical protein